MKHDSTNFIANPVCLEFFVHYGNTGCRVFKGGMQNEKVFWQK